MAGTSDKDRKPHLPRLLDARVTFRPFTEPESDRMLPYSHPLRAAALSQRKPTRFDLRPDADARAAIASDLGLLALPALQLRGELTPAGRTDFVLTARLEADVVQACVVSLTPVAAHLAEPVARRYLAAWTEPDAEESEVPSDDTAEPLGEVIDLGQVLTEALALALPLYPRAPGAAFTGQIAAEPGTEPLTDEKLRPFAGLADLFRKTGKNESDG